MGCAESGIVRGFHLCRAPTESVAADQGQLLACGHFAAIRGFRIRPFRPGAKRLADTPGHVSGPPMISSRTCSESAVIGLQRAVAFGRGARPRSERHPHDDAGATAMESAAPRNGRHFRRRSVRPATGSPGTPLAGENPQGPGLIKPTSMSRAMSESPQRACRPQRFEIFRALIAISSLRLGNIARRWAR